VRGAGVPAGMTTPAYSQRPLSPAQGLLQVDAKAEARGTLDIISISYEVLPDTSCARRGFCCSLLPRPCSP
jgi:hypothetical protein